MGRPYNNDLGPEGDLEVVEDLGSVETPECELDRLLEAPGPEVLEDEYPDYDNSNSRIISGPIGGAKFPGYRATSWRGAKEHAGTVGDVVKFWTVPGRWFARIRRVNVAA